MKDFFIIALFATSTFLAFKLHLRSDRKSVPAESMEADVYETQKINKPDRPILNLKSVAPKKNSESSIPQKNENLTEDQATLTEMVQTQNTEKLINCDPEFRNTDDLNTLLEKQIIIAKLINEKTKEESIKSQEQLSSAERADLEESQSKSQWQNEDIH